MLRREKKSLLVILSLTFILLIAMLVLIQSQKKQAAANTVPFTISGKTYHLLVADSQEEWERGLMFITQKKGFDGMLFEFPEAKPRTFWNKNTLVDLEVYWFAGDDLVSKAELPSIKKSGQIVYISSPKPVDKVVEIIQSK